MTENSSLQNLMRKQRQTDVQVKAKFEQQTSQIINLQDQLRKYRMTDSVEAQKQAQSLAQAEKKNKELVESIAA